MGRVSRPQRVVLCIAGLLVALGVAIGFSPVSITVIGDTSYACGSAFSHNSHAWRVDTFQLVTEVGAGLPAATPRATCPGQVYARRDIADTLIAFGLFTVTCAIVMKPLKRRSTDFDAPCLPFDNGPHDHGAGILSI